MLAFITKAQPRKAINLKKLVAAPATLSLLIFANSAHAAPNLIIDKKVNKTNPAAGEAFMYTIRYRCASLTEHCFDANIQDVIPADLEIANYSGTGGNVSNVTKVDNTVTWALESGVVPNRLDAGSAGLLQINARFPACGTQSPAAGSTVSNVATFTEAQGSASSAANGADVTAPTINDCPPLIPDPPPGFKKRSYRSTAMPGSNSVTYLLDFPANPSATEPYTITDIFPDGVEIKNLSGFNFLAGSGQQIDLLCGGVWYLDATSNGSIGNSALRNGAETNCNTREPLISGDKLPDIQGVRGVMMPGGASNTLSMVVTFAEGMPVGSVVRNTAILQEPVGVDVDGNSTSGEAIQASYDHNILEPVPSVDTNKIIAVKPGFVDENDASILDGNGDVPATLTSPSQYEVGDLDLSNVHLAETDAVWALSLRYSRYNPAGINLTDLVFIDDLPPEFDFIEDTQTGNFVQMAIRNTGIAATYDPFDSPACNTPDVTVIDNYNNTGRDRIIIAFPGCTLYGGMNTESDLSGYISGRLKPGTAAGTSITNSVYFAGANDDRLRCTNQSNDVQPGCLRESTLEVPTLSSIESSKYVQGELDTQFHRFPTSGYTTLDGEAVYELTINNTGNVDHTSIDIIDVLPHLGDTSLLSADARGSEWSEELAAPLTAERYDPNTDTWSVVETGDLPLGMRYSSSTNPCRLDSLGFELYVDEVAAVGPSGCDASPWTALPSGADGARSFGLRFNPATPLAPGEKLRLTVNVRQLTGEADASSGDIAWNSFAYGTTYDDPDTGSTTLLATEPLKVGVEMTGNPAMAAIGDYVWLDVNGDGAQGSGEPPIAGVRVNLYESDGVTAVTDSAGNPRTTTTDEEGHYMFWGLEPQAGSKPQIYVIRLDSPPDYTPTGKLAGLSLTTKDGAADDTTDSDASNDETDGYPEITALVGAAETEIRTYDFGFIQPASVGDFVWDDLNADGVQGTGEPGVADVVVNLLDAGGSVVATQTTNDSGGYLFENLVPGVYSLEFDPASLPADRTFTSSNASGNPSDDSNVDGNGLTAQFVLDPGEHDPTWDTGLVAPPPNPAAITGRVWEDLNADGLDNNGEPGVSGVEVQLLDDVGLAVGATTTDNDGNYLFDNLTPGKTYQVVFNPNDSQTIVPLQDVSGDDSIDSDANPTTGETPAVTPAADETIPNIDAGIISDLSLGNLVWLDSNDNGLVDSGESGIAGVTLFLFNDADTLLGTTTTDSQGKYVFTGLDAGDYRVEAEIPAGYSSSTDIASSATPNALDSDDNGINPTVTVVSSELITLASSGSTAGQASLGESDHGEPINGSIDSTPDTKAYYTVDFGFIIPPQVDLELTKIVDRTSAKRGETVTYTLTVTNKGPDGASGIEVTDQLPAGLSYVESTAEHGSYDPDTGVWAVGTLPANESTTLSITVTIK